MIRFLKQNGVVLSLLATLLFGGLVTSNLFGVLHVNPEASWDASWFYSSKTFYEFMDAQGIQGRHDYLILHLFDYLFLLAYTGLFVQLILLGVCGASRALRYLVIIPLLGGAMDLLEGVIVDISILLYPAETPIVGTLAGYVTLLKMVAFVLSILTIVGLGVRRIGVNRRR